MYPDKQSKESYETLLKKFREFDPNNIIPDVLTLAMDIENGKRISIDRLNSASSRKSLLTDRELTQESSRLFLENIGFEKEAAEAVSTLMTPTMMMRMLKIYERMVGTEWDGPSKHKYSDEEVMGVLKIINKIHDEKPTLMVEIVKQSLEKKIADLEKNTRKIAQADAKSDCISMLGKEVPVQDFTYAEAEDFFKIVKEKGEYAAYLNYAKSQHILEDKGCRDYFP
jgi:hypothetical protein